MKNGYRLQVTERWFLAYNLQLATCNFRPWTLIEKENGYSMNAKSDIEKVVKSLKTNKFNPVVYVEKAKDAVGIILEQILSDA